MLTQTFQEEQVQGDSLRDKIVRETEVIADSLYFPHLNQLVILRDKHKYKVIVAGRRFGKSAMAINYGLAWVMDEKLKNQLIWIVLPTYTQAKKIYWVDPDVSRFYLPYVQQGLLRKNDSDLSLYNPKTNSYLFLIGANNPASLRGSGLDLIIFDEPADISPEAFDVISPTLADSPNHRVVYIGTPNGYDHFHDLMLLGDHANIIEKGGKDIEPDPDWITFKFTSYDNRAFDGDPIRRKTFVSYIDKERVRLQRMGKLDFFEQEYMAEIRKKAGAVHGIFDRELHLIPDMELPHEWTRGRGFDFGSSHPTASIRIAIDNDDNWFVERCYKKREETIVNHIESLWKQDEEFGEVIPGWGDPSGAQWIKEFNFQGNKYRMSIRPARKEPKTGEGSWVGLGIDKINEKMHPVEGHTVFLPDGTKIENAPSFFILNREENMDLVDEIESLVYKEDSKGSLKADIDDTKDVKGHYDLHASLRYFAVSQESMVYFTNLPKPAQRPNIVQATKQVPRWDEMTEEQKKQAQLQADLALIRMQNNIR